MSKNNESNLLINKMNELPKNDDNISIQRNNLVEQKSKELLRIKKSISMKTNLYEYKNIKANINKSVESNANLKKENICSQHNLISKKKVVKMKSCITGIKNTINQGYNNLNKENNSSNNTMSIIQEDNAFENKLKIVNDEKKEKVEGKELKEKIHKKEEREQREEKEEKKEEYIKFYINNNIKNSPYKLKDNTLTTTKYNIFTFIPKGLLYQFSRWSNIYFLFTAIIQSNSEISPLSSNTAIIPLVFVLGVSLIREAFEDLGRYTYDNINNEEEVIVFRDNKFKKSTSQTLRHGEIILIYENNNIPTDILLVDTGGGGICYVETSSLDGEKNLKIKVANKYTQGFISNDIHENKNIEKLIFPETYYFDGFIKINAPNPNLNYVNGIFHPKFEKFGSKIEQDIYISNNEFLLKGSMLKNTNWIIGIVVYTGKSNKIILNSKKSRLKVSKNEKKLNLYLAFVFFLLIFLCFECSFTHFLKYKRFYKYYKEALLISNYKIKESVIIFFTYFLLLNTFIPISLIVTIEIVKIIQGIFIEWDTLLYSKWRHCFCSVKRFSIIEELGNVNFIFCDKTGTLTKNKLHFKYCIIENNYYKYIKLGHKDSSVNLFNKFGQSSFASNDNSLSQIKFHRKENSFLSDNSKLLINNLENSNIINDKSFSSDKNNNDNAKIFLTCQDSSNKKINNNIIKNKSLFGDINQSKNNTNNIKTNNFDLFNKNKYNQDLAFSFNKSLCKNEEMMKKDKNFIIFEENEFSFYFQRMIKIGEGYFSNPDNNNFLKKLSDTHMNSFNSINYIHEFWIALALANECMVKYDNGELKYISTSADDLELVKTAADQGYKLIETSLNTKVIRINGENYNYEVLKVLGFSSERKRMSIIIRYQDEIILYAKGADSEISKRLSKKNMDNDNYEIISNGLIEFSKKGLRTLMIAYRKLTQEEYIEWEKKLYENEANLKKKENSLDKVYDEIENNLILIGGTVVEDQLQDNVPQTIKELKSADIKIWILTGDKLYTSISIGYSSNLLLKEQKIFLLKMNNDNEDKSEINPFKELNIFFKEFQKFLNSLVKKYNLESKFINNTEYINQNVIFHDNIDNQSESISDNESNKSNYDFSIDFEMFYYLKDNKFLEPYSIIIEAPILNELFKDEKMTKDFLKIAYCSSTVICCRVSSSQKSQIIKKIKKLDKKAITLAIGDGSNDVSMITEANIGVGLHGEEGMSAVQASDFAIGEFQLLKRLLFVHGRNNLYRINEMIIYFFYKNFIFSFSQFYYSTRCLASGQTIIDDWYITCYNLIFTSIPLGIRALTDSDIDLNDKKNMKKNLALFYKENRDKNKTFTFKTLILDFLKGIFFSFMFYVSGYDNEILVHGYNKNMSYVSLRIYISIIIVVNMNLLIQSHFIAYILPLSIGITTFLLLGIFLLLNHYGLFFNCNSKASLFVPITSSQFILGIVLIGCFNFVFEYSLKLFEIYFKNSLSSNMVLRNNSLRKKRMKSISAFKKSINLLNNKFNRKLSFISRVSFNNIFNRKNSNKKLNRTGISKFK